MKDFFSRAFRLTFAGAIHGLLREPRSIGLGSFQKDYRKFLANPVTFVEVKGRLPLREHGETGETVVGVRVLIMPTWMTTVPIVFTDAPFLRPERDWHVPVANLLCYCQDAEWRWQISELRETSAASEGIINIASTWCIRNVDSLISRHLHGHRFSIKKWPKEWGQWSHAEEGVRECEDFIQKQKAA